MKATLLFATTLSMLLAGPGAMGMTELEALRARCSQQEQQIQNLEKQLRGGKPETVSMQTKPAVETVSAGSATHVVRAGESLERIARRHGCSASQLAKANGLRSNAMIHPGQKLKLPGAPKPSAASAPAVEAAKPEVSRFAGKTHTVRQGETYYSISRKYRISMNTLMSANPTIKATSLRPGLVLRLSGESTPKTDTPAAVSTPMMAAKPSYPEARKSTPVVAMKSSAPRPLNEEKPASRSIPVTTEAPHAPQASAPAPQAPAPAPIAAAQQPAAPAPAPQAAPAPQPVAQAQEAPAPASQASLSSTPNPEKKVRSVTVDNEMTYGDFATSHGTDTARLNDLNGLDLTHATVLAKGSELYVPAQP